MLKGVTVPVVEWVLRSACGALRVAREIRPARRTYVWMLLLGCLIQSGAQTPAIWPVLCEYKDGAGNTIVPAAGRPFVLWVHYRYDNPTASTYRIRWDFGGTTNYSEDINWGAGSPPGSYYYVLAAWTTLENAGTNVFTVRADCDDALAGAPLGIKTISMPLTRPVSVRIL